MRKIVILFVILLSCICGAVYAQSPSDLPAWEKSLKEENAKRRDNLLQQLDTLKQKEAGFYDNYVRNCTPATLTTLGTSKVLGIQDGMCVYNKIVGTKASMECKIPQEQLAVFADESINMINSDKESAKLEELINKYCTVK